MNDPDTPAMLDREALADLREMVGGDQGFLAEMIDTFLDDGPARLAEMETATLTGDTPGLRRAAHTLKSNFRTFGASVMADRCQRIEDLAASGDLMGASPLLADVVTGYSGVVAALQAERSRS